MPVNSLDVRSQLCVRDQRLGEGPGWREYLWESAEREAEQGSADKTACLRLDLDSTEQLCEDGKVCKMGLTTPTLHRGGVLGGFSELIHVKCITCIWSKYCWPLNNTGWGTENLHIILQSALGFQGSTPADSTKCGSVVCIHWKKIHI